MATSPKRWLHRKLLDLRLLERLYRTRFRALAYIVGKYGVFLALRGAHVPCGP